MLAFLALDNVKAVCASAHKKANSPNDMAVFYRHESEGRLQCEVKVYFSPAIADTAKTLGAFPCEQPTRYSLSVLVGTPAAWSVLFPEN